MDMWGSGVAGFHRSPVLSDAHIMCRILAKQRNCSSLYLGLHSRASIAERVRTHRGRIPDGLEMSNFSQRLYIACVELCMATSTIHSVLLPGLVGGRSNKVPRGCPSSYKQAHQIHWRGGHLKVFRTILWPKCCMCLGVNKSRIQSIRTKTGRCRRDRVETPD